MSLNMLDNNTVIAKPGYKTTEFYLTIATALSGILISAGFLSADQLDTLTNSINNIAGNLMTIISVVAYIWSRAKAKKI